MINLELLLYPELIKSLDSLKSIPLRDKSSVISYEKDLLLILQLIKHIIREPVYFLKWEKVMTVYSIYLQCKLKNFTFCQLRLFISDMKSWKS